jgi:hypothetical protein
MHREILLSYILELIVAIQSNNATLSVFRSYERTFLQREIYIEYAKVISSRG